jgi:hypothetical protein
MSKKPQIGDTVKLPNGADYHIVNREALRKLPKLMRKKENRSRHQENNYIVLEEQSFFAIDFTLEQLTNCKATYQPGIGLMVRSPKGELLDLFYELHWFNRCWQEISAHMGEPIDMSPIMRLFRKVEAGMAINEELHIDPCNELVMQCRRLYRKANKDDIGKIVDALKKQQEMFEEIKALEKRAA